MKEKIYSLSKSELPSVFDKSRWTGKAMEWAMKDEDFKVRLFRFIDVLPALKTDNLVVRLLKEYFSDDKEFQGIIKWGIKGLPAKGIVTALAGGIFSRSPANIIKARDNLRVGNLYINRNITGAVVGRQPFGGFGLSGVGSKAGGLDYLLQFMNPKRISENIVRKGFSPLE
jgi:hypothetical protein